MDHEPMMTATQAQFLDKMAQEFRADSLTLSIAASEPRDWHRALYGFADETLRELMEQYVPDRFDPPYYATSGTHSFGRGYWPDGYNASFRSVPCHFHDLVREKTYFPIVSPDQGIALARTCCMMKLSAPDGSFILTENRFGDVFARDHVAAAWLATQLEYASDPKLESTIKAVERFADEFPKSVQAVSGTNIKSLINSTCKTVELPLMVDQVDESASEFDTKELQKRQALWFSDSLFDQRNNHIDIPVALPAAEDTSKAAYGFRIEEEHVLLRVEWHGAEGELITSILTTMFLEIVRAVLVCAPRRRTLQFTT